MSNVADAVREEVTTAISKDQLQLPTLPEVALNIRDAAEREDISVNELAEVIGGDPSLAARLLKVANSPMYRGAREIESISMAVGRLGIDYTCNLATGLAMQQMFQATSEIIDRKLRAVWAQATQVAAISTVLARTFTRLKADQAMLAGLTHNIGALPILTWAEEHDRLLNDSITLDKVIDEIHGELGGMILRNWKFPAEIAAVPTQFVQYDRTVAQADYVDVVMVAHLQTYAGTNHPCAQLDWTKISAFGRVGLDPSIDASEIEDLSEDMQAAMEMLS
ncbi:MAG TPA: HDOD domain-containing protein [Pseudomonadales bacterium]|nr:HDOD domain-containing protein [Pseudomonadales bacterium]